MAFNLTKNICSLFKSFLCKTYLHEPDFWLVKTFHFKDIGKWWRMPFYHISLIRMLYKPLPPFCSSVVFRFSSQIFDKICYHFLTTPFDYTIWLFSNTQVHWAAVFILNTINVPSFQGCASERVRSNGLSKNFDNLWRSKVQVLMLCCWRFPFYNLPTYLPTFEYVTKEMLFCRWKDTFHDFSTILYSF
jgi:hypothetical protein